MKPSPSKMIKDPIPLVSPVPMIFPTQFEYDSKSEHFEMIPYFYYKVYINRFLSFSGLMYDYDLRSMAPRKVLTPMRLLPPSLGISTQALRLVLTYM